MTDHLNLIRIKLQHLSRMSEYLAYSLSQVGLVLKLKDWAALSPDQHDTDTAAYHCHQAAEEALKAFLASYLEPVVKSLVKQARFQAYEYNE